MDDHPFRSAAFGGFNKQDVLMFLEDQAKQTDRIQQKLQAELDSVQAELTAARQERDELNRRLETGGQEQTDTNARLKQTEQALLSSRVHTGQLTKKLEQVQRERDDLRKQLEALRPDAQAYVGLKERAAGVELEAHRRAQSILDEAEQDAQKVRRQMEQWLQRVQREYAALCSQVETTVSHAASQLEKAEADLEQLNVLMNGQSDVLEGVRAAYEASDPNRVEAPMPIEEE